MSNLAGKDLSMGVIGVLRSVLSAPSCPPPQSLGPCQGHRLSVTPSVLLRRLAKDEVGRAGESRSGGGDVIAAKELQSCLSIREDAKGLKVR